MKQKDMVLIIVVIFISGVISLIVSNFLFSAPKNRQEKVEVVESIVSDFQQPDKRYFNEQSINPTQLIRIGDNTNDQPFNKQ